MTITARVEADSISPANVRLTTFVLRLPKFLLAQLNTHRAFSRGASSSRAIPVERLIQDVIDDPVIPLWTKNQKGMQGAELDDDAIAKATGAWLEARDNAIMHARQLAHLKVHKQNINRILEPFAHASVVLTTTQPGFGNFLALRKDHAAQPEMQVLADLMLQAYKASTPRAVDYGEWHLPFIRDGEFEHLETKRSVSVARCARVSYNNHDGTPSEVKNDLRLFSDLLRNGHMGPFEHQARPLEGDHEQKLTGNFVNWVQFRKTLKGECRNYEGI